MVYLMAMGDDSVEEQLIGGEFFEGPADSTTDDDGLRGKGGPSMQSHWFRRGKRSEGEDGVAADLERLLSEDSEGRETAVAQWNNQVHKLLSVQCPVGFGLHQMRSAYNTAAMDRQFLFTCKRVRAHLY